MARKKTPLRPQAPQVKPSGDGTGQAASQPKASQQPLKPQVQQPAQPQAGQAQAAQTTKPSVPPVQQA